MRKGQDTVLITGATGQQGGALANELLKSGHSVVAMTRKPQGEAAQALAARGATIVQGDLNDAKSLGAAAKGKWGLFAVQNTWEAGVEAEEEQGKRLATVAREAGVEHFVYGSVASADRNTGIPHFENKYRIEQTIRGLGFPSYVSVRPVFYMENLISPWFKPGLDGGQLMISLKPETKLQMIAVRDIGKYLARAFEQDQKMKGQEIDIAGDELTMPEVARIIADASGRAVTHVAPPIEEVRKGNADFAAMLEWFDAVGFDVDIAANAKAFGVQPTKFADWARQQNWGG